MKKYTYKENLKQSFENCFISDTFDFFEEAVQPFNLKERRVLMIAEKKFSGFYLKQLAETLGAICRSFDVYELPDETPDFHLTAARINELARKAELTENDCIMSLGSRISDGAARVFSAEYLPGILYIKIPVTFIGQLLSTASGDSELGMDYEKSPALVLMPDAKRAGDVRTMVREVNPDFIYINIFAYKFLDETERISGIGEAIRCAISSDAGLFQYMEANSGKKANDFYDFLLNVVMNCLRLNLNKEPEKDLCRFGYTLAKGLEDCTNHIIPHGQAVGVGLVVANNIASNRNLLSSSDSLRIAKCMVTYGLSVVMNFTNDLIDAISAAMTESGTVDEEGGIRQFVLVDKIGHSFTAEDVTMEEIKTAMFYRR